MTGKGLDIRGRANALTLPLRKSQQDWLLRRKTAREQKLADIESSEAYCQNCGEDLKGPFCHACGQRDKELRRPWWSLLNEILDDVLSWDSRFFRTVLLLILMPGLLTRDYMDGHRARYVPPIRMYLITTILFFLFLSFSDVALVQFYDKNAEAEQEVIEQTDGEADGTPAQPDTSLVVSQSDQEKTGDLETMGELPEEPAAPSLNPQLAALEKLDEEQRAKVDEAMKEAGLDIEDSEEPFIKLSNTGYSMGFRFFMPVPEGGVNTKLGKALDEATINPSDREEEIAGELIGVFRSFLKDPTLLNEVFDKWLPRAMLLLVPFFAFMLRTMHWGKKRYYMNQLIFSIHFHTFLFLLMMSLMIIIPAFGSDLGAQIFLFGAGGWLFMALKITQDQGWIRTTFKFIWLSINYMFLLFMTFSAIIGIAMIEDSSIELFGDVFETEAVDTVAEASR